MRVGSLDRNSVLYHPLCHHHGLGGRICCIGLVVLFRLQGILLFRPTPLCRHLERWRACLSFDSLFLFWLPMLLLLYSYCLFQSFFPFSSGLPLFLGLSRGPFIFGISWSILSPGNLLTEKLHSWIAMTSTFNLWALFRVSTIRVFSPATLCCSIFISLFYVVIVPCLKQFPIKVSNFLVITFQDFFYAI